MKLKSVISATCAAAALLASTGASADVFLNWDVDKSKRIDIDIFVAKFKFAYIDVLYDRQLDGAAEAEAFGNQWNAFNRVTYFEADKGPRNDDRSIDMLIDKTAEMKGSFNQNQGVVQANQDAGNMVNQGNFASIALTNGDSPAFPLPGGGAVEGSFTHSEAYSEQVNRNNYSYHRERTPFRGGTATRPEDVIGKEPSALESLAPGYLQATIEGSLLNNAGVVHFNQNVGNSNNQLNALAAAIGDESAYALADAGIAQVNAYNEVFEENTTKYNRISASANGNSGILNVNQSVGHQNNQSTVVSISAISSVAGIGLN
jgi:hypothetical protein